MLRRDASTTARAIGASCPISITAENPTQCCRPTVRGVPRTSGCHDGKTVTRDVDGGVCGAGHWVRDTIITKPDKRYSAQAGAVATRRERLS